MNAICFILFICLLFFILEYLIFKSFILQNKNSLIFFFYLGQSLVLLFVLHFNWGKNLFYLLLKDMNKNIILRDPQDFLFILLNSSFYLLLSTCLILFLGYIHVKVMHILRENEYVLYQLCLYLILYAFTLTLLLFIFDLNSFHWEIFYQDKTFDFQPELTKWYFFYKGEFLDLLIWLVFIFVSYLLVLVFPDVFNFNRNGLIRLLPFLMLSTFSLYFFGGESLLRDCWLSILCFTLGELFIYIKFFFVWLHKYKVN